MGKIFIKIEKRFKKIKEALSSREKEK